VVKRREGITPGRRGVSLPPAMGRCQIFTVTNPGWESEKLTACTPDQLARISGFHPHRRTRNPADRARSGGGECPERQVQAQDQTFRAG